MTTKIILVRHGETDWNRKEIFRGRLDPPLSEKGQTEAKATGSKINNYKVRAVYSSPLIRSLVTAEKIAEYHDLEVIKVDKFIDMDFGKWQGLTLREVESLYPKLYQEWQHKPHLVKIPEGESLGRVRRRSASALKDILAKEEDGVVVIVSHRVVIKVLLCAILGLGNSSFWKIRQDNCAINIFNYKKNGFSISVLNDTCHLQNFKNNADGIDF